MKELDYIRATNLAKLRIAVQVLREVLPTKQEEPTINRLVKEVTELVSSYERVV